MDQAEGSTHAPLTDCISQVQTYVNFLYNTGSLKSKLYHYLLDLIEEDAITSNEDVCCPYLYPNYQYVA
jgi:hypothetical protein